MKLLLSLIALLSVGFSFSQQYSKVKIYADSDGLQQLSELGVPVDHGMRKANTFIISDFSEAEIQIIQENGFAYEVVIKNVKEYYSNQSNNIAKNSTCAGSGGGAALPTVPAGFETNAGSYAGFYTYQQMLDALDAMAAQYPTLITVKSPVSSFLTWEGRPIYHVKISDNPASDEAAETKVLYTAIHHAREPMSMSQTIFYMWYLLENYATNPEIQFLVDNTEMYFVPCINPDGYLHNEANDPTGFGMHRKNKRPVGTSNPGVDLNRNYSYGWGTTGVSFNENDDTYPGGPNDGNDYSFSEPETQAMQWLVQNINFTSAFNAHTHGNTLLHPIGTTNAEFADHHDYFTDLSTHMCSKNGYFPQKSSGLYPASGDSDDYMYKVDIGVGVKDTMFVMTPEIGSGFWPSQGEVVPTCQGMVFPNMVLSHMTHKYLVVNETDPGMIATMTGDFNHDVQRLGREDGAITVSIDPILNIQSVGADVIYDIPNRATGSGTISYVLDPAIQFGDEIRFVLNTVYATWTKHDTIVKTFGSLTLQLSDDASNTTNWTGQWALTSSEFVSPSSSFTDSPGNYQNNDTETYEFINDIDLTNANEAMISYYAMWEIEADYDYCQFQVSVDGGTSWIGQCGNYTVEGSSTVWNGSVQPDGEPVYEGTQASWVLEEINMSDYLGQTIKVRFILESDGGVRQDGFYFDDFQVSYTTTGGLNEYGFEVKTFPNPANDEAIISTSKVITNGGFMVYDQTGQLVISEDINEQTNKITVNTAQLPQGIYTVRVNDNGEFAKPVKLVVMH
jgi:carboxypeptidase T